MNHVSIFYIMRFDSTVDLYGGMWLKIPFVIQKGTLWSQEFSDS